MSNKLFVGGLSWDTNNTDLRDAFDEYGNVVDAKIITERDTGRSRGFGFVTFESEGGAVDAMSAMNGANLDGRTLNVDMAKERSSSSSNTSYNSRW